MMEALAVLVSTWQGVGIESLRTAGSYAEAKATRPGDCHRSVSLHILTAVLLYGRLSHVCLPEVAEFPQNLLCSAV